MLNIAVIMGRLVADPELKHTPNDVAVASFTLAVESGWGNNKRTDFITVVAWRKTAEFVCKYFSKGQLMAVEGSIQIRNYEDKQGSKRKSFEIVANQISFCGERKDEKISEPVLNNSEEFEEVDFSDEDLPF